MQDGNGSGEQGKRANKSGKHARNLDDGTEVAITFTDKWSGEYIEVTGIITVVELDRLNNKTKATYI